MMPAPTQQTWRTGAALIAAGLLLLAMALSGLPRGVLAQDAAARDAEARYKTAASAFHHLRIAERTTAAQWQAVAKQFLAVHQTFAAHRRGAHALFSAALAYREAFQTAADPADIAEAVDLFHKFAARYPEDSLADDCLVHIGDIFADVYGDSQVALLEFQKVMRLYPNGDQADLARIRAAALAGQSGTRPDEEHDRASVQQVAAREPSPQAAAAIVRHADPETGTPVTLKRVQFLSTLDWTRVILTLSAPVDFRQAELPAEKGKPRRMYIDLPATALGPDLNARYDVGDAALTQIRIGRYDNDRLRVVLDVKELERSAIKAFDLPRETKIVFDLHASRQPAVARKAPEPPAAAPSKVPPVLEKAQSRSLSRALGLKVRTLVIDAGHGGHDPGAVAHGLREKDIVLAIAKDLRDLLAQRRPDLKVIMTRDDDEFIPLQRRTRISREANADLFVSIHVNAHDIHRFSGIETYFLNLTTDASALEVAARENASTEKQVSDLNAILLDLLRDTNIIESGRLAKSMQSSLVSELHAAAPVKDLGVKQAPFMVLMGSDVPSVLVEAGFITNPDENRRLKDKQYQRRIAEGIYAGLHAYMDEQTIASDASAPAASAQAALVRY